MASVSAKFRIVKSVRQRLPVHGWIGIGLVAVFWPVNWFWPGLRTHVCFFPLWLGYCLTVDALALRRTGTSLLARSPTRYAGLFLLSARIEVQLPGIDRAFAAELIRNTERICPYAKMFRQGIDHVVTLAAEPLPASD